MPLIHDSDAHSTVLPLEPIYDADGRVWLWVYYENDGVKNTPMRVYFNEKGYTALDLADNSHYYFVGVPADTFATAAYGRIQIGGDCNSMITASIMGTAAGYAFKMDGGAVAETGADWIGGTNNDHNQFCIVKTLTAAAAAVHDVLLVPLMIHSTT